MSRLAERPHRLERRLGPCPDCRAATIELRCADTTATRPAPAERCGSCHESVERITVVFAFDPYVAGA
jgi:hypothetical protein